MGGCRYGWVERERERERDVGMGGQRERERERDVGMGGFINISSNV